MNYSQAKSAAFKFKVANNKDRVKNSDGKFEWSYITDIDIAARPCVRKVNNYEGGFSQVIKSFEYDEATVEPDSFVKIMGTCRGELRITTDGSVFRFRHDGVVKHTLSVACTDEARLMAHWLGFIGGIVR